MPKLSLKSDYVQIDKPLPNFGKNITNRTMDMNHNSSSRDKMMDKSTTKNDQKLNIQEEDDTKVFVNFSA